MELARAGDFVNEAHHGTSKNGGCIESFCDGGK